MRSKQRICAALLVGLAAGVAGTRGLKAQQAPSVKRTILLKQDMTIMGREAVMATVELPPGSSEGRHTHPAEVYGFVLQGTVVLAIEGQPAKTLKAGDVFTIAPGQIHEGSNKDRTTAKLAVVFVAEKDKPLISPVSQ